jgi:hypothetical protein
VRATAPISERDAPKTLHFDLDGTIVHADFGTSNEARRWPVGGCDTRAGFVRLVCVANVCTIESSLVALGREVDGHDMIFQLCQGAFRDQRWFAPRPC